MRAAREQPRVVIAKALALLCLLVGAIAIGTAINGDNRDEVRELRVRATTAEQMARNHRAELERIDAERGEAVAARARAKRALARVRRVNRILRRDLDVTERRLQRARNRR